MWRDGKEIRPSTSIKQTKEGDVYILRILKTSTRDSGDYSIVAFGPKGEAKSIAELYVDGKKSIIFIFSL